MQKNAYKIMLCLGVHSNTNFCDLHREIGFFSGVYWILYTYCVFYHVLAKNIHLQFEIFYFQTQNTSAYFNGIYTLQHCWYVNVKDKAWHRQVRLHIPKLGLLAYKSYDTGRWYNGTLDYKLLVCIWEEYCMNTYNKHH